MKQLPQAPRKSSSNHRAEQYWTCPWFFPGEFQKLVQLKHLKWLVLLELDIEMDNGELPKLPNLEVLILRNGRNQITDANLWTEFQFPKLRSLDMASTRITDSGIEKLVSACPELRFLDLLNTSGLWGKMNLARFLPQRQLGYTSKLEPLKNYIKDKLMNLEKFKVLIVLVTMSFCGNCYCQESAHDEGSELATIVPEVSPPTTYDLLNEPGVQKDLELSEDQTKQVWTINSEFGHQMIASNKSLHEGNMSVEDYKVLILARRAAYQNHLDGLLLPHQLKRIQQLAIQTHINQVGTCNAISSKLVVDELNISEEQKRELIERSKAIEKTLAEEIERLKTKAKDELLSVLSDEQRTKLTELTGDKYNPKNTDWEEGRQAYNRFIQQRK